MLQEYLRASYQYAVECLSLPIIHGLKSSTLAHLAEHPIHFCIREPLPTKKAFSVLQLLLYDPRTFLSKNIFLGRVQ